MADMKVSIREHKVIKETQWGEVEKSLHQDFVFVNDKLAGYYSHKAKKFLPLAGWDNDLSPGVVQALRQLKKDESIGATQSVPIDLPVPVQEDEDDE